MARPTDRYDRPDDWQIQQRPGEENGGDDWNRRRQADQSEASFGQRGAQHGQYGGQRDDESYRRFDDRGDRGRFGQGYNRSDFGQQRRGYGDDRRFGQDERGFLERAGDEVSSWFGDDDARRRRNMDSHRGKGPKGYTRADDRILEDVNNRLSDDDDVDASGIEVSVTSGEVTLTGEVGSRQEKRMAEDCVERVAGVTHVQNNLRVRPANREQGTENKTGSAPIVAGPSARGG
jgi:osmotically-inducible protein OsmY